MDLIEFSVTNYRSITAANKIKLHDFTVLVGKNNEGKSNLLNALNVAMTVMMSYAFRSSKNRLHPSIYDWERDFPVQYQNRKKSLESIFKLNIRLKPEELEDFHNITGIRGNEDIPVSIKIGPENRAVVEIPKKGSSSYNRQSIKITQFISERLHFNYIQAIRTEQMAKNTLSRLISSQMDSLKENPEYIAAIEKIQELQQELLDGISAQLLEPLKEFLPSITDVKISLNNAHDTRIISSRSDVGRSDFDVIINDGTATNITTKGDGIKSLVTLALLKERSSNKGGVSVIAIEEPESHLHPGAIHSLVDVINKISENNQVIITTHNPLFVRRNSLSSNVIVDSNTAKPAKTIADIRNILGVWTSDNLTSARFVLVVEGEDDKISLSKILPYYSTVIGDAIKSNKLIIKPLGGAGNLCHDIVDLRSSLCQYYVLLDNDSAGQEAANKAIKKGILNHSEIKYTICNGCPEAEFEDCLNPKVYFEAIKSNFSVDLNCREFKNGKKKWSDRVRDAFLNQGSKWSPEIEENVKSVVANAIPISISDIDAVIIQAKSGFIQGLVTAMENMLNMSD